MRERDLLAGSVAIGIAAILSYAMHAASTLEAPALENQASRAGYHDALDGRRKPGALTFNKDVAPVIFQHCAPCHRPDQVAPFPLLSYQDVKKRARLISEVMEKRLMPPWKPESGSGDFLGVRRLTDEQVGMMKQWADAGSVEGDPRDLPLLPRFPSDWYLGQPDLVATMSEPFEVPADGPDVYRCFVLPLALPGNKYFVAFDLRPSNRRVVHHALAVEAVGGAARRLETSPGAGYPCFGGFGILPTGRVGFWTPGAVPVPEPEHVARVLKKNSDLVLQIHFHPTGKVEKEQSTVAFYFAQEPPARIPADITLGSINLDIPPGEKNYKVTDSYILPIDVEVIGIIPHAHYLGREIKAMATLPDGTVKALLWIKDWDFNWQQEYRYAAPVKLPRGTRLEMEWIYDNSADNPRNPNHPPKRVTWGEQTTDEMAELHLEVIAERPAEIRQLLLNLWQEKAAEVQARLQPLLLEVPGRSPFPLGGAGRLALRD